MILAQVTLSDHLFKDLVLSELRQEQLLHERHGAAEDQSGRDHESQGCRLYDVQFLRHSDDPAQSKD